MLQFLKGFSLCLLMLLSFHVESMLKIDDLIKVTPENNQNCVEYYNYKEEHYCSLMKNSGIAVDPHIKDYETQNLVFDARIWQPVWGQKTLEITSVEYALQDDNVLHWHELITSEFIPDEENKLTPKHYADFIIQNIKDLNIRPLVDFIEVSPEKVIFEFRVESPENLRQDELQIISKEGNGLYSIRYLIKEADMGHANREKWLENLKKATVQTQVN